MTLARPSVQRIGDDFTYSYGVGGVRFEVSGVTESRREGIHAWTTVRTAGGKLSWGRLKLDSARERGSLAKDLQATYPSFPWADALAQVAELTYELNRAGEPTVRLWDVPAPLEPQYLVDPLLPLNETTMIFGDGAAGKSMLALWLGLAVASGTVFDGFELPRTGPVIYLDWETNAEAHVRRLRRMATGEGIDASPEIYYRPLTRPLSEEIRTLTHEIARLRAVLVIVDSLGAAAGVLDGESINSPNVGAGSMNLLRSLGVTRLVVHHMSHDSANNSSGGAPIGSRYFRHYSRCLWELRRSPVSPDRARIALYNRKMNEDGERQEPIAYEVAYEGRSGPITLKSIEAGDDTELLSHMPLRDQLVHHLSHGAMTTGDLVKLVDANEGSVRRALSGSARFVRLEEGRGSRGGSLYGLAEHRSTDHLGGYNRDK